MCPFPTPLKDPFMEALAQMNKTNWACPKMCGTEAVGVWQSAADLNIYGCLWQPNLNKIG